MSSTTQSNASLADSLKQANDLAAKLKEQVAAREAQIKQMHDLLTTKATEIEQYNKMLQDGDAELGDLQEEITSNHSTLLDYGKLLDAQQAQLNEVLSSSS